MDVHDYPDGDLLSLSLADKVAADLATFVRREGRATLAISARPALLPVFDILSGVNIDWSGISILLVDEIWPALADGGDVAAHATHAKVIAEHLMTGHAAAATFIPFLISGQTTPEEALASLRERLEPVLPISVLIEGLDTGFGLGALAPGIEPLGRAMAGNAPPAMILQDIEGARTHIALALPALRTAFRIHLVAEPGLTRAMIEEAAGEPADVAPVRAVLDVADVHYVKQGDS